MCKTECFPNIHTQFLKYIMVQGVQSRHILLYCLLLPSEVQNLHTALQNCQRIYETQHKIYSPIPS